MKTLKSLLALLILPTLFFAQASISCPADAEVHAFDLDENYASYGDPVITNQGNFVLDKSFLVISNSCQTAYSINTTITYRLLEPTTNTSVASCEQKINVVRAVLDDVVLPEDITVEKAWVGDPPTIEADLVVSENIVQAYEDLILPVGNGDIKILRTHSFLDWCTADFIQHVQVIKVINLVGETNIGTVSTCDGQEVQYDGVLITTDAPGVTIDQTSCVIGGQDLMTYVNCVAAANPIPAGYNYKLEVFKDGDDLNGVSTLDLVMIQRHILGLETFDSPCKVIAADVSNNESITALDLIEMRKLILGLYTEFPATTSWKFVNAQDLSFGNTFYPDVLNLSQEDFPLSSLNIIAIKVGDVNASVATK